MFKFIKRSHIQQ